MGDLPDDWWTTDDVARFLSVSAATLRAYISRGQMPTPERRFGSAAAWRPDTIREWQRTRRRGARKSDMDEDSR